MNSIEFPEMNYKHFREKNAKFHIFLLLSIMGGISLITIYDRKFRHNRPEEGLPKMITYISPINMVAEDNHLYFAYKSPLGKVKMTQFFLSMHWEKNDSFWPKKLSHFSWTETKTFKLKKKIIVLVTQRVTGSLVLLLKLLIRKMHQNYCYINYILKWF